MLCIAVVRSWLLLFGMPLINISQLFFSILDGHFVFSSLRLLFLILLGIFCTCTLVHIYLWGIYLELQALGYTCLQILPDYFSKVVISIYAPINQ